MSSASFSESFDSTQPRSDELWDYARDYFGPATWNIEHGVVGPSRTPESPEEALEYGHIDGITYDGDLAYGIAVRDHPYSRGRCSLGIRTRTRSGGDDAEWQDLQKARETDALFPKYYLVGFHFSCSLTRDAAGSAFRHVFVVDTAMMMDAIDAGRIDPKGPFLSDRDNPNDDSEAMYVDIDDLAEIGAIVHRWDNAEWVSDEPF